MRRVVAIVALAVGGVVLALGLTLSALAVAGADLGDSVQPRVALERDGGTPSTTPSRAPRERPSASPSDDHGGNSGSGSDDSSGSGSGSDDHGGDSSGPGSGSDDHSGGDD